MVPDEIAECILSDAFSPPTHLAGMCNVDAALLVSREQPSYAPIYSLMRGVDLNRYRKHLLHSGIG